MTMKLDWMRGCATALVTPFKSDGSIDEERMRSLVDRQAGVKLGRRRRALPVPVLSEYDGN